MSRPILYASDGHTPIAFEAERSDLAGSLLMVAFGALKGLTPRGEIRDSRALWSFREQVATGIVDFLGQAEVEKYFGITMREDEQPQVQPMAGKVQ